MWPGKTVRQQCEPNGAMPWGVNVVQLVLLPVARPFLRCGLEIHCAKSGGIMMEKDGTRPFEMKL